MAQSYFIRLLEKVQHKPEPERRRLLKVIVVVLFSIIFVGWLTSVGVSWGSGGEEIYKKVSPFSSIGNLFSGTWQDISRGVGVVGKQIGGATEGLKDVTF